MAAPAFQDVAADEACVVHRRARFVHSDVLPVRDAKRLSAQAPGGRRSTILDSLGVSVTPAVALPQIAPLAPPAAEAEVSDSDWEAEVPPPPHETATSVASTI